VVIVVIVVIAVILHYNSATYGRTAITTSFPIWWSWWSQWYYFC